MKQTVAIALVLCCALTAKDRRRPAGDALNEVVGVNATYLDSAELRELFGTDFDNLFSVIEVTLTPKSAQPLDIHLDDFLMRSEQTGEHSGPLLASQIAGQGTLVLHQSDAKKQKQGISWGMGGYGIGAGGGSAAPPPEIRAEIKNSETRDPLLDTLKRKILAERPASETVSGLLFFPLEKEKPKNLVLIYTTAPGKLRIRFK